MTVGGVIDRARRVQRRPPWRRPVSQRVLAGHARWYCYLVTAGVAFALLAAAVPRPAPAVAFSVGTLGGGAAVVAYILWREASRITRPALWLLAILGAALASAAAATAASRQSVPGASVGLGRDDWLIGGGALMLGALVVRRPPDGLRPPVG